MKIDLKIVDNRLYEFIPNYATPGSAGLDLRAAVDHRITITPSGTLLIPTGIVVHIKDNNYCGIILPRSGLGHKHGIILGNSVGLLDSDYQGQIMLSIWNRSNTDFEINPMDRIAQLVIVPIMQVEFNIIDDLQTTSRNDGGFGSTGIK